jgi:hypothetical protein
VRLLKHSQLPGEETPPVDIISPSDPSVARWVTEAEQGLLNRGKDL